MWAFLDEAGELDCLFRRLHAGPLAARVALDDDAERPACNLACGRQAGDGGGVVCGHHDLRALQQPPQATDFFLTQDVVADEDIVDAPVDHHLCLAEFLAGDAPGACRDLHPGERRALVRLDMRPVGDAGRIAQPLHAGDVGLDPVQIDHHGRRAELACDLRLESSGAHRAVPYSRETSTSLEVMNSSSAGWPFSVAAIPRLMAATISPGFSTRSP